ncbi:acetyl-CoA acetyltransferase [Drepanopeziza brunnea f. sp. 'multigermtubi' MB_m1]|uniref:acetyl-CoA C-acyltransferase n=1 Tax=Marssonina brunnea f. sp. multigermtubi (strain MB_m1) TaxID=1072389 RepID=K1XVX6_MARBU|nr:acetyl-CoA acetyltransferase [Drepanopeziza brunnea f. sp. 'multigermtubi' MB_m1]EKD16889.1 acetyl-CoA acetyltransferase [Drepanopeziza brunnea f. sp. 'multigermtubi' MB_m1]
MSGPVRKGLSNILRKEANDIVILSSLRTPITRSYKGQLKDAYPEELLATVLRATLAANPNLDPALIQDVGVGVVLSELGGSKAGRMAMNHIGIPTTTSFYTTNRACSSGLSAITNVSHQIATGMIDVGIGAGMESMTRNYGSKAIPTVLWPELQNSEVQDAKDCIMPMGLTSENVAERYGVNRADQDAFAVASHQRAAKAQQEGLFDKEIVPVHTRYQEVVKGEKVGEMQDVTVSKDDGIRFNASFEGMQKLKPAFKEDGTSTAGNSSQISDGAAATLLMRRSTATELGLTASIIGRWAGTQVAGCRPDQMGIGPAVAIPKLLECTGLKTDDVGIWEINEAFASQAIYCLRELGLEKRLEEGRVNPKGGAIALGHPLGATGARMVAGLLPELERQGLETGVVSMCIGTGMGMAGLFVRE